MKKHWVVFAMWWCLALAVTATADAGEGVEQEVAWSEVPPVVQAVIEQFAAGGEIDGIKMEEEEGQVIYEAEIEKDGRESEIEVTAAGETVATAVQVDLEELPEPVRTTIAAFAAVGEIDEIMLELEGEEITYEAEVDVGEMEFEIEVSPAGLVLKIEAEKQDEDDDGNPGDDDDEGEDDDADDDDDEGDDDDADDDDDEGDDDDADDDDDEGEDDDADDDDDEGEDDDADEGAAEEDTK